MRRSLRARTLKLAVLRDAHCPTGNGPNLAPALSRTAQRRHSTEPRASRARIWPIWIPPNSAFGKRFLFCRFQSGCVR